MKPFRVAIFVVAVVTASSGELRAQPLATLAGTVMPHPRIFNLYWDNNWDGDNNSTFSVASIDGFTRALVATPYFAKTAQYGVTGASFLGSAGSSARCGGRKPGGRTNSHDIGVWVQCEVTLPGTGVPLPVGGDPFNTLYVVYLPPGTTVTDQTCASGSSYHSITPQPRRVYAVVPFDCQTSGFGGLTTSASHEIVEAATDPTTQTGWRAAGATSINLGPVTIPTGGEAADLCPGSFSFFSISVAAYWSNEDGACVIGATPQSLFTPQLSILPGGDILEDRSVQYVVSPSVPVVFSIPPTTVFVGSDPPSVTTNGLFWSGSGTLPERNVPLQVSPTDGSASTRTIFLSLDVVKPLHIQPTWALADQGGTVDFHEAFGIPVIWSVEGAPGRGSIDANGRYTAPAGVSSFVALITATPTPNDPHIDMRPPVHASVRILPPRAVPDNPVSSGELSHVDLASEIPRVCVASTRTDCIRIYPAKDFAMLQIAPSIGHFGDPASAQRKKLVEEIAAARIEARRLASQLAAAKRSGAPTAKIRAAMQSLETDRLDKLEGQVQDIDSTYHAPTLQEMQRSGFTAGQSVKVIVSASTEKAPKPVEVATITVRAK